MSDTNWITASLGDLGHYPLLVAGGGAAGTAAAITAGRLGVPCLLVEPLAFLGGTGVAAQVTPWMGNAIDMGPLNEGLSAELQRDLEAAGQARGYSINPEALKGMLERKCLEAGVTLLYETSVVAVERLGNRVATLALATRAGLRRVRADVVIDASGDAHAAILAGVPCRAGRESDRVHQPMSLRFVLGGLDVARVEAFCAERGGANTVYRGGGLLTNGPGAMFLKEFAAADQWPAKWQQTFSIQFFEIPGRPGELWFNCPRLTGYDPLDPLSLSAAYVEGRRMIDAYVALFRRHVAGAENVYLVMSAPMMGIREGRRIVGRYTLTGEDFLKRRKFPDGICFNRYPIDIHNPHGQGLAEWTEMPPGAWHEIPYRCLLPEGLDNMLVAGRCISSDFSAQASYRIIPNCRTLGEAAAVAVSLAGQTHSDVSAVDGVAVRQEMLRLGLLPRLPLCIPS